MMALPSRTGRCFAALCASTARLRGNNSGATLVIVALTMSGLIGLTAATVDIGKALVIRKSLQSATDSAALSGAGTLAAAGPAAAIVNATEYGAQAGGRNELTSFPVTMVSGYPQTTCLTSIGVSCVGSPAANAVVVRQEAVVTTYFTRIAGISSITVSSTSTAAIASGVIKPVEVMLLLDTTGSMNEADKGCNIAPKTKFACAMKGAADLMTGMAPSAHKIGLMTFPPSINAASAATAYDCNASTKPESAGWDVTDGVYQMVGLENDFRTADDSPVIGTTGNNLNGSSNIVKALVGSDATCARGLSTMDWNTKGPGASGGTAYAAAITKATDTLTSTGSPSTVQRAMIILTDGAANRAQGGKPEQCNLAVQAAQAAKAAGIWVYTVAYGLGTNSGGCSTDKINKISPCDTLRQMASDPSKFFSSETGTTGCISAANPATGINSIFPAIGKTFFGTRLVPNSTT